jgi:hypothetical protein
MGGPFKSGPQDASASIYLLSCLGNVQHVIASAMRSFYSSALFSLLLDQFIGLLLHTLFLMEGRDQKAGFLWLEVGVV